MEKRVKTNLKKIDFCFFCLCLFSTLSKAEDGFVGMNKTHGLAFSLNARERSADGMESIIPDAGFGHFLPGWRAQIAEARRLHPEAFEEIGGISAAWRGRASGTEWMRGVYSGAMLRQSLAAPARGVSFGRDEASDAAMSAGTGLSVHGLRRKPVALHSEREVQNGLARNAAARMAILERFLDASSDGDAYEQTELLDAIHALWDDTGAPPARERAAADGMCNAHLLFVSVLSDPSRPHEVRRRAAEWLFDEARVGEAIATELQKRMATQPVQSIAGPVSERGDKAEAPLVVRIRPSIEGARACALICGLDGWRPAHFECSWEGGAVVARFDHGLPVPASPRFTDSVATEGLMAESLVSAGDEGTGVHANAERWREDMEDQAAALEMAAQLGFPLAAECKRGDELRRKHAD